MLARTRRLADAKTGHEKTDRQIDGFVRELSWLTEEEIAIAEDAAR